jgi:hypothetical protein
LRRHQHAQARRRQLVEALWGFGEVDLAGLRHGQGHDQVVPAGAGEVRDLARCRAPRVEGEQIGDLVARDWVDRVLAEVDRAGPVDAIEVDLGAGEQSAT